VPFKPPIVTELDRARARQIVRSITPLKQLSCDDAEIVAKAIAESFAQGRKQGLEMAKAGQEGVPYWQNARSRGPII
jgi:hypothetical protein